MSERADVAMVARGLAPTRSAAQRLIQAGAVRVDLGDGPRPVGKAGEPVEEAHTLSVVADDELRWASRAGLKLETALPVLREAGWPASVPVALDVGQSTGGFTDVLLATGAARVLGIDVGHGQLHARLAADARVLALEGVNAREMTRRSLTDLLRATGRGMAPWLPKAGVPLAVADLSFISLAKVLPAVAALLAPEAWLLLLVKPQFEAGREAVGKRGIVAQDAALVTRIREGLEAALREAGCAPRLFFPCGVPGSDGNREHFLLARRLPADAP